MLSGYSDEVVGNMPAVQSLALYVAPHPERGSGSGALTGPVTNQPACGDFLLFRNLVTMLIHRPSQGKEYRLN